jgi:hypothetical protein
LGTVIRVREIAMGPLRKEHARHDGLTVAYTDEVTEEQVRRIDDLVREEFERGHWEVVERES